MDKRIIPIQAGVGAAYLVITGNQFFLVDTGSPGKGKKIREVIRSEGLNPENLAFIFLTHTHYDHAGGAAFLKEATGSRILVHETEAEYLSNGYSDTPDGTNMLFRGISFLGKKFKNAFHAFEGVSPDVTFSEKKELPAFGIEGYVLHTPGHTAGSSSLIMGDAAFVGDTMFHIGPYKYPPFANDEASLLKSWDKLLRLEVETFYPAHGKPLSRSKVLEVYELVKRRK